MHVSLSEEQCIVGVASQTFWVKAYSIAGQYLPRAELEPVVPVDGYPADSPGLALSGRKVISMTGFTTRPARGKVGSLYHLQRLLACYDD
jgi:hypothetical protein